MLRKVAAVVAYVVVALIAFCAMTAYIALDALLTVAGRLLDYLEPTAFKRI